MMTEEPINSTVEGLDDIDLSEYRTQKLALEEATKQLQHKSSWPKISIIRPGAVETSDIKKEDEFKKSCGEIMEKSDVDVWVSSVINTFAQHQNIHVSELSIGHTTQRIPI